MNNVLGSNINKIFLIWVSFSKKMTGKDFIVMLSYKAVIRYKQSSADMATYFKPVKGQIKDYTWSDMKCNHLYLFRMNGYVGDNQLGLLECCEDTVDEFSGIYLISWSDEVDGYSKVPVRYSDILYDVTEYKEHVVCATKIQNAWRAYKQRRDAAKVIQTAWKRWLVKKNELYNPHCFVGLVHLVIEASRAVKETAC